MFQSFFKGQQDRGEKNKRRQRKKGGVLTERMTVSEIHSDWTQVAASSCRSHLEPANSCLFPAFSPPSPLQLEPLLLYPPNATDGFWSAGPLQATSPPSVPRCTHTGLSSGFNPQKSWKRPLKLSPHVCACSLFGTWKTCGSVRHGGHTRRRTRQDDLARDVQFRVWETRESWETRCSRALLFMRYINWLEKSRLDDRKLRKCLTNRSSHVEDNPLIW